jgi:hypothetical protein
MRTADLFFIEQERQEVKEERCHESLLLLTEKSDVWSHSIARRHHQAK